MVDVFIKNVDKQAYKLAKMIAAKDEKNIGQVVSESIFSFAKKPKKKGLAGITPVDFGPGTEKLSMEIDDILYR